MTDPVDLAGVRDELLALGTATLYEASGSDIFLPPEIRPAWPGAKLVGLALPVRARAGDNLPLHLALEEARPGDVLIVDGAGAPHGYWGEVLSVAAQQRGVVGLIIDGGVRDIDRLEDLGFPAFSRHVAIEGTLKDDLGVIAQPIRIGRADVSRGDVVVADRDGVAVIPAGSFADVLERSRARGLKETQFLERIRAGESTVDLYDLRRT